MWKISQAILGSASRFQFAMPTLWLLHSYVGRTVDFEFQPSALAVPFVLLAFLFAIRDHRFALVCTLVFLLGFKEHLSLVWISAGVFLLLKNPKDRLALVLVTLGAAIGPLIYAYVMPLFVGGAPPPHAARFGPFALIPAKVLLIVQTLLSVGLLPILAPRTLLWVLPAFGIALISRDPQMVGIGFHYQDVPLALVFVSALYGLHNLEHSEGPRFFRDVKIRGRFVVVMIAALIMTNTWYPFRSIKKHLPTSQSLHVVGELRDVAGRLPPACAVWTLDSLGSYLYETLKLRVILTQDENIERDDAIVVIAQGVPPWPLKPEEIERLRGRLSRSNTLTRRDLYQSIEVYSSKNCLIQ